MQARIVDQHFHNENLSPLILLDQLSPTRGKRELSPFILPVAGFFLLKVKKKDEKAIIKSTLIYFILYVFL